MEVDGQIRVIFQWKGVIWMCQVDRESTLKSWGWATECTWEWATKSVLLSFEE